MITACCASTRCRGLTFTSSRVARLPAASARPARPRTAGAQECHRCRDRNRLAPVPHRPRLLAVGRGHEAGDKTQPRGRRRGRGGLVVAGLWFLRGPGPMAFAGGPKWRWRIISGPIRPAFRRRSPRRPRGARRISRARCRLHGLPNGARRQGVFRRPGVQLSFGTLYSTNITPDKETGIGNIVTGIPRRDGSWRAAGRCAALSRDALRLLHLYQGGRCLAIKAYLFSLPPVEAPAPANTLMSPFNQRWALTFWSVLFNRDRRFEPYTDKNPEWNGAPISPRRWPIAASATRPATWLRLGSARNSPARWRGLACLQHQLGQGHRHGAWSDER